MFRHDGLVCGTAQAEAAPVLKPTVFCYHRCPYCDLRQDYYRDMVLDRKRALPLITEPGSRRPNPGHMPLDLALRTIDEAAARWAWKTSSSAAATRCCTRI